MAGIPQTGLQLLSTVKSSGELELRLAEVPVAAPTGDEVLVRIEASPINPSDLGLLLGPADISTVKSEGGVTTAKVPEQFLKALAARLDQPMPVGNEGAGVVIAAGPDAKVPEQFLKALAARLDQPMPVGNEGAGVVIAAGPDAKAQALVGKTVALLGGAMYGQYRTVKAGDVLPLPADASAADGASCFVNPLTALGMTETMRAEGHTALVHTAAASNLGQMLNKICIKDGIDLVNIVRSPEQAKILKDIGAKYVVDSSAPTFQDDLLQALIATNATIAFDAIGGGKLAGQILAGMEAAANSKGGAYSRYGSSVFKQVYIYGGLDTRPSELNRNFGLSWSLGGWLLTPFLAKLGPEGTQRLRQRVVDELKTTFASHYTAEISLAEVLDPKVIAAYQKKATGEKFLVNPAKGL